jgi:hypothetical protein
LRLRRLTIACLAGYLYLLLAFKYERRDRHLWLMPALMVLWVNFHGGYLIGIALLALFVGCEWLTFLLKKSEPEYKRKLIKL